MSGSSIVGVPGRAFKRYSQFFHAVDWFPSELKSRGDAEALLAKFEAYPGHLNPRSKLHHENKAPSILVEAAVGAAMVGTLVEHHWVKSENAEDATPLLKRAEALITLQ